MENGKLKVFNAATNPVRIRHFPAPPGDDIARQTVGIIEQLVAPYNGVCVQPGTSENPGPRADSIRPYKIMLIKNFQLSTFPKPIAPIGSPLCGGANWV